MSTEILELSVGKDIISVIIVVLLMVVLAKLAENIYEMYKEWKDGDNTSDPFNYR